MLRAEFFNYMTGQGRFSNPWMTSKPEKATFVLICPPLEFACLQDPVTCGGIFKVTDFFKGTLVIEMVIYKKRKKPQQQQHHPKPA